MSVDGNPFESEPSSWECFSPFELDFDTLGTSSKRFGGGGGDDGGGDHCCGVCSWSEEAVGAAVFRVFWVALRGTPPGWPFRSKVAAPSWGRCFRFFSHGLYCSRTAFFLVVGCCSRKKGA